MVHYALSLRIGLVIVAMPQRNATAWLFERVVKESEAQWKQAISCRTGEHWNGYIESSCLLFTTYGYLLRRATKLLPKAAILICDEAHSRTADLTVLHALLKHMLTSLKLNLKVIFMGVALNVSLLENYYDDSFYAMKISGRSHELIAHEYTTEPHDNVDEEVLKRAVDVVTDLMTKNDESIMLFVKGKPEVEEMQKRLKTKNWLILPFHAELEEEDLARVKHQDDDARNIVVVSTSVGEGAITLPYLRTVVSTCRTNERVIGNDGLLGMSPRFNTQQEIENQRGRVGRTYKGSHYQLVPKHLLSRTPKSEIKECNDFKWLAFVLTEMDLSYNTVQWRMGERPSKFLFDVGVDELKRKGYLEEPRSDGKLKLTASGTKLASTSNLEVFVHREFLYVSCAAGIGDYAAAAISMLEIMATCNPFIDPQLGFDKALKTFWKKDNAHLFMLARMTHSFYYAHASERTKRGEGFNIKASAVHNVVCLYKKLWQRLWIPPTPSHFTEDTIIELLNDALKKCIEPAFKSMWRPNCFQDAKGLYIRPRSTEAQSALAMIPLDTRKHINDKYGKCRLAVTCAAPRHAKRCLIVTDSFLKCAGTEHSMLPRLCGELRKLGFVEVLLYCKGSMRIQDARSYLAELQYFKADVSVLIYNINDAVRGDHVYCDGVNKDDLLELTRTLLSISKALTCVIPTEKLFPKYNHVKAYADCVVDVSNFLMEQGFYCEDAMELVGQVKVLDGTHFDDDSGGVICNAVMRWVQNAEERCRPLK